MAKICNFRAGLSYRLTGLSYRLTALSYRLTALSYRLTGLSYRLTGLSYRLTGLSYRLTGKNVQQNQPFARKKFRLDKIRIDKNKKRVETRARCHEKK